MRRSFRAGALVALAFTGSFSMREIYDVNQLRDGSEYIVRGLGAQPK